TRGTRFFATLRMTEGSGFASVWHVSNFALALCVAILGLLSLLALVGGYASPVGAQQESRAGLVVQYADGSTQTSCVAFGGESITGLDVLLRAGLEVTVESQGGLGALVCKIGLDGCNFPEQPCVCQSYGPGGVYWSYHHLKDGKWRASGLAASTYKVRNGDVEGWAWSSGSPPPVHAFEQICGVTQPEPTHTLLPLPTSTPIPPQPTNTSPPPSVTPVPPLPTNTRELPPPQSPTRQPQPTATRKPDLAATPVQPAPAIETAPPTDTPQPEPPTSTAAPTNTPIPTSTPTGTSTPILSPMPTLLPSSTSTPTAEIAATITPTPNTQHPTPDSGFQASTVGIVIGAGTILGLLAWGLWSRVRPMRKGGGARVE
ncbi:MAG TPA: hypothetical protein VEW94_03650, partial [Chloroflexia bacterium]|nr:hypothetical protein [Chloroflexia bacterium]